MTVMVLVTLFYVQRTSNQSRFRMHTMLFISIPAVLVQVQ